MIAFVQPPDPDPYEGQLAFRSSARATQSPAEIAASIAPDAPGSVTILPFREEGYSLDELAAQSGQYIVMLPERPRYTSEGVIVLSKEEVVQFLYRELTLINSNLPDGVTIYPDVRISASDAGSPNAFASTPQLDKHGNIISLSETVIFNCDALLLSKLNVAGIFAHEIGHLWSLRSFNTEDPVLLDANYSARMLLKGLDDDRYRQAVLNRLAEIREEELVADSHVERLSRHDPRIILRFAEWIGRNADHIEHDIYSTHPTPSKRLNRLNVAEEPAVPEWNQAQVDAFIENCAFGNMTACQEIDALAAPVYTAPQLPQQRQR